ncbi:MAG: competence/damage-inducible protein A [Methylomonas sp.]|nr:MAG: competence/damage-inducible protein A [Methylomonas sp.]
MRVIAEIFSQGEEVVSGQTVDSNAAWLSQNLNELGFVVKRHTAVGDCLEDLVALILEIAVRADCCLCTGGLGPTIDDLTAEAASRASGQDLLFDPTALQGIEAYFAKRQRSMPALNRKQAYFPTQAVRIDNPVGTAPGFAMQIQRCWFVFLPGVPSEMKAMFSAVREQLLGRFSVQPDCLVSLRSVGIGESAIQQRLESLVLPNTVQLGFRAAVDEVQTKLLFPAAFAVDERMYWTNQVAGLIGDAVFAIDTPEQTQGDLPTVIGREMTKRGLSLSVIETASQGLIAAKCIGQDWLRFVQFSANIAITAERWGCAYFADDLAQSAAELARHLQQHQGLDWQLVQLYHGSITDPDQPIVLYNALQTRDGLFQSSMNVAGRLQTKQNQAAMLALDLLRRTLKMTCL